ncbi:MAG TPA: hypothetical protein VNN10_01225, partial [Dehalococcoidia bacterium]|nr:hypothetical protein [Dehalococcoidia bacterium]
MRQILSKPDVDKTSFEWVSLSPDGKMLAVVQHYFEPPGTPLPSGVPGGPARSVDSLLFYDLDANRELRRVESTLPEFEGFDGMFDPLMWLGDGSGVFMWGQTNSERPGSYATVYLDGSIQRHDLEGFAYVAPNGQVAVSGIGSLGCMFISGHRLDVRHLSSDRSLASIENQSRAFTGVGWSPASREFLFESRPWREGFECADRWWAAEPL